MAVKYFWMIVVIICGLVSDVSSQERGDRNGRRKPFDKKKIREGRLRRPLESQLLVTTVAQLNAMSPNELKAIERLHLKVISDSDLSRVGQLRKLTSLKLEYFSMADFPDLADPSRLRALEIHNFPGGKLPKVFSLCKNLEFLIVKGGQVKLLPDAIGGFSRLRHFEVDACGLEVAPASLSSCLALEYCALRNSPKVALATDFLPKRIKSLDISGNGWDVFPFVKEDLYQLRSLNLSGNLYEKFPFSLIGLHYLESVVIEDCPLKEFPDFLASRPTLKRLVLGGFKCDARKIVFPKSSNLEELSLTNMGLTRFPNLSQSLRKVRFLNLDDNKLTNMSYVGQISSLEVLSAANNSLRSFPMELSRHKNLEELNLSNCLLQSITFSSSDGVLKELNLSGNDFSSGRMSLSGLSKLEKLNLSDCGIKKRPLGGSALRALKSLDISKNSLGDLPYNFTQNKSLAFLDLSHNEFSSLPEAIASMVSLQELNLFGNDLKEVPIEGVKVNWGQSSGLKINYR